MNRSHWLTSISSGLAAAALIAAVGCGSQSADRSSSSNPPANAESDRPADAVPAAPEAHPAEARDRDLDRPSSEPEAGRSRTAPPATHEAAPLAAAPTRAEAPPAPAPPVVKTIPAGTELAVVVESAASSQTSQVGQPVQARLAEDFSLDGRVVVPSGATLEGSVVEVVPQKKIGGVAKLALAFTKLRLPSGEVVAIAAGFAHEGKSQTKKDAATIGGSAAGGALLGKILGGSTKDAAIGAVVGAAAGSAVAANNKADAVDLPVGTHIKVQLTQPAEVTLR